MMILNRTSDCKLKLDLANQPHGVYLCGVLFVGRQNITRKAVFNHFVIEPEDNDSLDDHRYKPLQTLLIVNRTLNEVRSIQAHSSQTSILLLTAASVLLGLGCSILIILSRKRTESPEAFPMVNFTNPEPRRERAYSYPSTPHERDEADHALSSLELMAAPSPPPLPLSFTPVHSLGYSDSEDRSARECRC